MIIYERLPETCPENETAVALGMFDGLHRGHMAVIDSLMENAGGLAPCIFTFAAESMLPKAKSDTRLLSGGMRDSLLRKAGVSYLFQPDFAEFRNMAPEDFARFLSGYLHAKAVFCGEDFRFGKGAAASCRDLEALLKGKARVHIVGTVSDNAGKISTTRIRELLEKGDVLSANGLLGRAFTIDFEVRHGRGLGRRLDFPTINQPFPRRFAALRFGVYASAAIINGKRYCSITNIGVKPTVGSDHVAAETYIMDFSGDLYGQRVHVELLEFIRDESRFKNIAELKSQIERDSFRAKSIYQAI